MEAQIQEARQQETSITDRLRTVEVQLAEKDSAFANSQRCMRDLEDNFVHVKQTLQAESAQRSDAEHSLAQANEQVCCYSFANTEVD